jgi:CubicO group peptidase (beta-lactamase class C family)
MKKIIILAIVATTLSSCLKDEPFKLEFSGFEPIQRGDDWQTSSPEQENVDRSNLTQAYELLYKDDRFTMARSLLVFRNGKLIAEAYPHDPSDIDVIHNIQSCTKSFTSILTGIAIQDNYIDSIDERLYDIYPEYFDTDADKRTISIEDALTMQTGLEFDNGTHTEKLYKIETNSVEYVLSLPNLYRSGTFMNYNDGAPQLVSKVIEKKTGMSLSAYADTRLLAPLNIKDWKWESANDGTTFGAFSLYLKPRDFGKIGQLLLQYGHWNNETLIDSVYLQEATDIKVSANFSSEPYGYYFWILPAYGGYAAIGHGGQFLMVVPEKRLVVVYTSWPYTSGEFFDQRNDLMNLIVNSCK